MKRNPRFTATTKPSRISPELLEGVLLSGFAGTLVLSILPTNDAPPQFGLFLLPNLLWMLLAVGTAALWLWRPHSVNVWSLTDSFAVAWMVWNAISICGVINVGDLRAAVNGGWQAVSFSLAIMVGRRLLHNASCRQAIVALLLVLAGTEALLGLYQFTIDGPAMRGAIAADPQAILSAAGISSDLDAPEAKLYLDRARSTEPLGTFTLTNSLAGFLLPAIVILLATIGIGSTQKYRTQFNGWCRLLFVLLLGVCLLLTKSRTAFVSLLLGIAAMIWLARGISWKWLAGISGGSCLLGLIVLLLGGLDWQVWSEAPKSVQYRLEYWQSTKGMILDHPWLGVGSGNFQSVYPRYQLPQASETIADPHNFLFEIAATTGLPGLFLFLALLTSCCLSTKSVATIQPFESKPHWLFGGALLGLLIAPAVLLLNEMNTNTCLGLPVIWWAGIPLLIAAWYMVSQNPSAIIASRSTLIVAIGVLLLNLLAAGGIGFPSIAQTLAVLLVMVQLESRMATQELSGVQPQSSRWIPAIALLGAMQLLIAYYFTGYAPVLAARMSSLTDQQTILRDRWDPELVLQVFHSIDRASGLASESLLREAIHRNPRSPRIREQAIDYYLEKSYFTNINIFWIAQETIPLQPNSARIRAKIAWMNISMYLESTYFEDRKPEALKYYQAAISEANEALRLDALNPHAEKKLANIRVSFKVRQLTGQPYANNWFEVMQLILKTEKPRTQP